MSLSDFMSFLKVFTPGTSANSSNDTRRQCLTRLKFIATLKPHDKIDSRTLRIESNNILTPIKRLFITGDSRESALNFFSSTIDRAFELIALHSVSADVEEKVFCANIIQDLIAAVKGLQATQKTYDSDTYTVCEIQVLIQMVQAKIWKIQQAHPDLFTMKELCVVQLGGTNEQNLSGNISNNIQKDNITHISQPINTISNHQLRTITETDEYDSDEDPLGYQPRLPRPATSKVIEPVK